MQFPPKKFDDPHLSSPQEIKPVTADHTDNLEDQAAPTMLDAGWVLVRTEKGLAEIAKRSMQVDFRHRIMLMQVNDCYQAARYFPSFGGAGAQILQNLLDEGFLERR